MYPQFENMEFRLPAYDKELSYDNFLVGVEAKDWQF